MNKKFAPLELLAPSCRRPTVLAADLVEQLESNRAQLWTDDNSAIFTAITDYHRSKERVIEAGPAGGDLKTILQMVPGIETWARAVGCTQAHITMSRRGWMPALKTLGFEEYATIMRKVYE